MADRHVDVLLVGGGVASAACADELRAHGFAGSILLAGRELDPPYERPPVTKEYLRGALPRDEALWRPPDWYAAHGVELRTRANVSGLDPAARTARVGKEEVAWTRALVATGANVRRLPVPGSELEGIHHLRALGNADALRRDAEGARRAVLVGGSYIGCEVACTLTALGLACTVVMQEDVVLSRHFGARAGRWVQDRLEERGIGVIGEVGLARFVGEGRVASVVLDDGRALPADVVVIGAGVVPDAMLARQAGLPLGDTGGVRCDARLRTEAEGVWAAGDMCEYLSPLHEARVRIEHHDVAVAQGRSAARDMVGAGDDGGHRVVPSFWSDLGDGLRLEYVGLGGAWDAEELRGSLDDAPWTLRYRREGRLVGALTAGRPSDLDDAREEIAAGA